MPSLDKSPNLAANDNSPETPLTRLLKPLRELENGLQEIGQVEQRLQLGIRVSEVSRVLYRLLQEDHKRAQRARVKK